MGILGAAFASLVVGGLVLIFKKANKKKYVKIQNGFLIGIIVILFIAMIGCFAMIAEMPAVGIMTIVMLIVLEYFIIKRVSQNYDRLKQDDFDEDGDDNNESNDYL